MKHTRKARQRYLKKLYNNAVNHNCNHLFECIPYHNNFVTNLQLSSAETSLLSKGLNFIPTGRDLNQVEIISSFDDFVTRLHKSTIPVTKHMDGNTSTIKFTSHRMTEQNPTVYQSSLVEGSLNQIKMALTEINTTQNLRPNLTIEERKALKDLSNNQNVVRLSEGGLQ